MIRSDSGVAHRLSLSARVVSTLDSQVKTKRQWQKRLWRRWNRALGRDLQSSLERHPRSLDSRIRRHHCQAFLKAERQFYPDIIKKSVALFQSRPRR